MIRVFQILTLLWACALGFGGTAKAQSYDIPPASIEKIQTQAYYANPAFEAAARSVLKVYNPAFSFTAFRRNYALTRQYAPISDPVTEKMLGYVYVVETSDKPEEVQEALRDYQALVFEHLGNIRVVIQAYSQAKRDERFGDAKALNRIRSGLLKDLMVSGDGLTLRGAYDVITLDEEVYLFRKLGLRVLDTLPNKEGAIYYNMHSVEDVRTGRAFTVFVNTTMVMQYLDAVADLKKDRKLNIRRQ